MKLAVSFQRVTANARYRAILPVRQLQARGHPVCWPGDPGFEQLAAGRVPQWDLLHVQQSIGDGDVETIRRLQDAGIAVTWDSDDDISATPKGSDTWIKLGGKRNIRKHFKRTIEIATAANLMTTTNEHLAQVYRDAGVEHVVAIENNLDPRDVSRRRRRHQGVVVGLVAAGEHANDLRSMRIAETLVRLLRTHGGVQVVVIGVDLRIDDPRYTHFRIVPPERLIEQASVIDIGIAPLADTPFNRARSNVKLKEYAAAGAMWLASPVGPYRGMGEEQGGLLVDDGDWFDVLGELAVDYRRRVALAERARAWVKTQSVRQSAPAWEAAFRDAIARARR